MPKLRRLFFQVNSLKTSSCHMTLLIVVAVALCFFATADVSSRGVGKSRTAESQPAADNTHILVAPYYSVKGGLKATLMLSNQGPSQLPVQVRLFNRSGVQFDLPPLTLSAHEVRTLDLGQAAPQVAEFEDGNVRVEFQGKRLGLGSVLTLLNVAQSIIFDEELTEPAMDFASNRLEGVWWKPEGPAETLVTLSNTGSSQLSVTVRATGQGKHDSDSTSEILTLGAHETWTLTTESRLPGHARPLHATAGGISIHHSGAPGELVAAGFIQETARGFSNVIDFSDPQKSRTARLDGAGLRFGTVSGVRLSQIAVVRNISDATVTVSGRVPYTLTGGEQDVVTLPSFELATGELKKVSVPRIREADEVKSAGLEFTSTGGPGTIIASALSLSADRTQVFRVPMRDAAVQSSSTGEYPWSLDDSSSSIVYIKNTTESEKQFTLYVDFDGGSYALGVIKIPGGQTNSYDIRSLRDGQVPDANGKTISLSATQGHVHWSVQGKEDKVLIGRVEQFDLKNGLSMTAACGDECCPDSFNSSFITPSSITGVIGDTVQCTSYRIDRSCSGENRTPYPYSGGAWSVSDTSVATIDGSGLGTAIGIGSTDIYNTFYPLVYEWDPNGMQCNSYFVPATATAFCLVKPLIRITRGFDPTIFNPATVSLTGTPNKSTAKVTISTDPPCSFEGCLKPNDYVVVGIIRDSTGGTFTFSPASETLTQALNPGGAINVSWEVTPVARDTPSGNYPFTIRITDVRRPTPSDQPAEGRTLFLDEIINLPLPTQAKFLRALQERQVQLLGGKQPVPVAVRIIAASNIRLELEVRAGRFRQDVYYRLNEFGITLPPLRERDDILTWRTGFSPKPAWSWAATAAESQRQQARSFCAISGRGTCGSSGTSFAGPLSSLRM